MVSVCRFFCFFKNNSPSPPIPISGNAKVDSLKDPATAPPMTSHNSVEPIFAPMMIPTALINEITPAPINATVITDTTVLLCVIEERIVPVRTDLNLVSVKCLRSLFIVPADPDIHAVSIIFIPMRKKPVPAKKSRI